MLKVALVYSYKLSAWVSCQKIVSNLVKAYELNSDQYELLHIDYSAKLNDYEFVASGKRLVAARPDLVVFLDHQPHPLPFVTWLLREFRDMGHRPGFVFHLFGDFTLHFRQWSITEALLQEHRLTWYAASERQRNMLTEFIPEEQLHLCPFPVDAEEFNWEGQVDRAFRKQQGWADDEMVFLFTGRLSRQKRIHQLVRTFAEWKQESKARARLVIVGDPDKLGEPWLGKGESDGEYFHYLQRILDKLPAEITQKIHFYGFRPNRELPQFYRAADCLVNISVHNDEDYGMTCAEALACGLPAILTDWAGFQGFRRAGLEAEVLMVPVKITPKGKLIKLKALKAAFQAMYQRRGQFDRTQISRVSLAWTSLENAANIVSNNSSNLKVFAGFKPLLQEAARKEYVSRNNTFSDFRKKSFNELYFKVYRHYVGPT